MGVMVDRAVRRFLLPAATIQIGFRFLFIVQSQTVVLHKLSEERKRKEKEKKKRRKKQQQ